MKGEKSAIAGIVLESARTGGSIPAVKHLPALAALMLFGSCSAPPETLVVKTFQLRDQSRATTDDPMVRMEKGRRLRGAVSMEERRLRLGQYHTVTWNDPKGAGLGPVEVVFLYQQGASASRIKRMSRTFPASAVSGTAEFAIIGDDYFLNGKVLAWRASVSRGGTELASRQSYLWK